MRRRLLLALVIAAAGCATDSREFIRDGVRYGVTEGPFRGRWWNYYERGRSFLDGGFFVEARRDFDKALAERNMDQRWARTYGLHFVAQYFPNREAGVIAYYLEDYATALELLQRSYVQEPSARAAYYLRQTLEVTAGAGDDTQAPALRVANLDSLGFVAQREVALTVVATDDHFVDAIEVDGAELPLGAPSPRLEARTAVLLAPGANRILLAAEDIAGNRTETEVEIAADFDGPLVSFDQNAGHGVLSGVLYDPAGVASFLLNGMVLELVPGTDGTMLFEAPPATLAAEAVFVAEDTVGNVTSGRVALAAQRSQRTGEIAFAVETAPRDFRLDHAQARLPFVLAQDSAAPMVRLANLADGQRYLGDELVVDIEVNARAGVASLSVNGVGIPVFPDRRVQRLSRRVPLEQEGPNEIVAVLRDARGRETLARVTIERVLTEVEQIDRKLSLAILGNIWEGPNRDAIAEERVIADELTRALFEEDRFELLTRELLPQVLTEQELRAAVGDRTAPSPLRDIVPAEIMAVGMVRKDVETVEIILQGISLETSQLMGYADVAGKVSTRDDLRRLVDDLALRFLQEFPRVQGRVVDVRNGGRILASLSAADRVRRNAKCLVFRRGPEARDPLTGASLGFPTEILAEGKFDSVKEQFSIVDLQESATTGIEIEDFVITK